MILTLDEWEGAGIVVLPTFEGMSPIARALRTTRERVVLDLHVGDAFERDHQYINMPDELVLRPGESVRLRTLENVTTPNNVFGFLCSRASLAAQGFYVSNIKVDPWFSGMLEVAVFNGGRHPIHITRGMAFASLAFAWLSQPPSTEVRRTPTPSAGVAFTSWKESLRAATPFIITGVVTFLAAIIVALVLKAVE